MKTKQKQDTLIFNFQELGAKWEINPPIFFAKFQEMTGVDAKPFVVNFFEARIKDLEEAEQADSLTEIGKTNLAQYKTIEQILTAK